MLIGHDAIATKPLGRFCCFPGTSRLLPAHQIEVFNILPVKFDGKAFDCDDFHECLTLPLPFDRDAATVHGLLFEGILTRNFTPFWKPRIDGHRLISSWNASKEIFALFIGSRIKMPRLVRFASEQDVAIGNGLTRI
jgi:hypothetical protein